MLKQPQHVAYLHGACMALLVLQHLERKDGVSEREIKIVIKQLGRRESFVLCSLTALYFFPSDFPCIDEMVLP